MVQDRVDFGRQARNRRAVCVQGESFVQRRTGFGSPCQDFRAAVQRQRYVRMVVDIRFGSQVDLDAQPFDLVPLSVGAPAHLVLARQRTAPQNRPTQFGRFFRRSELDARAARRSAGGDCDGAD
jgi:hypothetical protein